MKPREEIRCAQIVLEGEIANILEKFNAAQGVMINKVDVEYFDSPSPEGGPNRCPIISLNVDVGDD